MGKVFPLPCVTNKHIPDFWDLNMVYSFCLKSTILVYAIAVWASPQPLYITPPPQKKKQENFKVAPKIFTVNFVCFGHNEFFFERSGQWSFSSHRDLLTHPKFSNRLIRLWHCCLLDDYGVKRSAISSFVFVCDCS